jgi:hypothetical protein
MSDMSEIPIKYASTRSAEEDAKGAPPGDATPKAKPNETTISSAEELDGLDELSPMRTHEQSGHEESVADRLCHLAGESDEEDESKEKEVNLEKLHRKELRRQKTSDKPNRLRDRLKRTVSKAE